MNHVQEYFKSFGISYYIQLKNMVVVKYVDENKTELKDYVAELNVII